MKTSQYITLATLHLAPGYAEWRSHPQYRRFLCNLFAYPACARMGLEIPGKGFHEPLLYIRRRILGAHTVEQYLRRLNPTLSIQEANEQAQPLRHQILRDMRAYFLAFDD